MDLEDYKKENEALRAYVADLEKAYHEIALHNMQLGQKVDIYYDVRRRVHIYKELLVRHSELLRHADLRNDDELMANRDWNVAACAQEAGFTAIRSFNRKFQDAIGMTPHEYRRLFDARQAQKKEGSF